MTIIIDQEKNRMIALLIKAKQNLLNIKLSNIYNLLFQKFCIKETVDLVTFTEEILNGKLHFLCNVRNKCEYLSQIVELVPASFSYFLELL